MTARRKYYSFALFILILLFVTGCPWKNRKADLILTNGVFFTGNTFKPVAEMVAIHGNRILAVGKNGEADQYRNPTTRMLDLKGKFGCSGFNDAHAHLLSGGQSLEELDLTGVRSILEMQKKILEHAWKQTWGSWIIGRGWDQNLFPNGEWPSKKNLDEIAPDFPMVLTRVCGHVVLVNDKVLKIAGITNKTPDPIAGEIGRDPSTGEPNGILKEEAIKLVSQYLSNPSEQQVAQAVENALEETRRYGVTSVQDYSDAETLSAYKKLFGDGRLTCRITLWAPLDGDFGKALNLREQFRNPMLRFGLLKGFLDGSMGSRTAVFFTPYSDDSTTCGISQMTQEKLNDLVLFADKNKFQIALHAIGDKAVRMGLDAYEKAQKANGARFARHRIEHAQALSNEDLPRFKSLDVVASMQPAHCIFDMAWAEARLGPVRCKTAYAWKSLLDHGVHLAFGSDWPVAPINPMLGIYAAVSRRDTLGFPEGGWYPRQKLTIEQALAAYTIGSAYAEWMENEKGSLEQGKLADIVILDHNLFKVSPNEILHTKVVYTIVDGKIVYSNASENTGGTLEDNNDP